MEALTFKHIEEILNIILFMSTGTLTLVGLISFFGSITLQQKIVVAIELLNKIEELISTKIDETYGEKVINLLSRYKLLSQSDSKYVHIVINIIKFGLIMIVVIWLSILIITAPVLIKNEWIYLSIITFIIAIIISLFIYLIGKLYDVFSLCSLPKYEELLDINNNKSMDMLELVGKSMQVFFYKTNGVISIELGFPMMFTGVDIIFNVISDVSLIFTEPTFHNNEKTISINLDDVNCYRHLNDKYIWYPLKKNILDYKELNEYIKFQLDLHTSNSYVKASFDLLKSSIVSSDDKNYLIPSSVIVPICNQSDILSSN